LFYLDIRTSKSQEDDEMILIEHLMDPAEPTDGTRLWIEPIPLTLDLRRWCRVDGEVPALAPERHVWQWLQSHPDGYEYFRAVYHSYLERNAMKTLALELAFAGMHINFTLPHQGDDPAQNSATALYEFLSELQAYSPP
jgi:uncharacterized protein YeaO (DUF488 family)